MKELTEEEMEAMSLDEQNKYYIPSIEEFYVGFEFYRLGFNDHPTFKGEDRHYWYCDKIYNISDLEFVEEDIKENMIKCKHLDKEDIESLGWNYNELTKDFETTIQGRTDTSIFEYWLSLVEFKDSVGWRLTIDGEDNENSFNGTIKNKSELKVLMKKLGIQ